MEIMLYIVGAVLLLIIVCISMVILPYAMYFHMHSCKHCGHRMVYMGLKENERESHFLFHCPHCGAWEQPPKEEFIREFIDKGYNPNEQSL